MNSWQSLPVYTYVNVYSGVVQVYGVVEVYSFSVTHTHTNHHTLPDLELAILSGLPTKKIKPELGHFMYNEKVLAISLYIFKENYLVVSCSKKYIYFRSCSASRSCSVSMAYNDGNYDR